MFCSRKGLTINGVLHGGGLRLWRCLLGRHPFVYVTKAIFMVPLTKKSPKTYTFRKSETSKEKLSV